MSNISVRIKAEPLKSLAYTSITSSYVAVGSALINPSQMYSLVNMTTTDLIWSWDGINDHGFLGANGGSFIFDLTTNRTDNQEGLYIPEGVITYVKMVSGESSPTTGSVYLTSLYSQLFI